MDEGDVIKNDGRYLYQVISEETKTATSGNYAFRSQILKTDEAERARFVALKYF